MPLLFKRDTVSGTHFKHQRNTSITIQNESYSTHETPHYTKTGQSILGLVGFNLKFIKNFAKIAKPLTLLTRQQVKFDSTPTHHTAFLILKEAITQAPILCYPDPNQKYIIYTDVSDDACGAQLSQEHHSTEFPIAFLSHTFTET